MMNNLTIKLLDPSTIDAVMDLQEAVFEDLKDRPDSLRKNTREMFLSCLQSPNRTWGLYDGDLLAGIGIWVDVRGTDEDLSLHLEKHAAAGLKSSNAKLVMIRSAYYGCGFQQRMLKLFEDHAKEEGFDLICATVAPDNTYSRNNLIKAGYEYDHTEVKYGGLARDVLVKMLQ